MAREKQPTEWTYRTAWNSLYRPDVDAILGVLNEAREKWAAASPEDTSKFAVEISKGTTVFDDLDDAKKTIGPDAMGLTFKLILGARSAVIGFRSRAVVIEVRGEGDDLAVLAGKLRDLSLKGGGMSVEPEQMQSWYRYVIGLTAFFLLVLLSYTQYLVSLGRTPIVLAAAPLCILVALIASLFIRFPFSGGAWLVPKEERPGFFFRNRDQLRLMVIGGIIGAIITAIAGYLGLRH